MVMWVVVFQCILDFHCFPGFTVHVKEPWTLPPYVYYLWTHLQLHQVFGDPCLHNTFNIYTMFNYYIHIISYIYICKMFYVVVLGTWSFITFELNSERKTHSTTRQNQASNLSETEISGPFNLIWWKQRMTTRLFHGLPCYSALSLPHSVASYRMADQTAWRRERKSSRESLDHLI